MFQECDEAGVGRVGSFPIPIVIGGGLFGGDPGCDLSGKAGRQDKEEEGGFHSVVWLKMTDWTWKDWT